LKILFYPAISLDGFIAKLDGDSNWVTKEDEQIFAEEVRKAGCVIVGNKTFQQYKGIIYPFPDATTFVCSSRAEQNNESANPKLKFISGEVAEIIEQIKAAGFTNAVLSGGGETNGRFAEAQAIDEMLVSIYPHFVGSGIPIFGERHIQLRLELLYTRQLRDGISQNRYKVLTAR
jgi:dihydrofolate reductase